MTCAGGNDGPVSRAAVAITGTGPGAAGWGSSMASTGSWFNVDGSCPQGHRGAAGEKAVEQSKEGIKIGEKRPAEREAEAEERIKKEKEKKITTHLGFERDASQVEWLRKLRPAPFWGIQRSHGFLKAFALEVIYKACARPPASLSFPFRKFVTSVSLYLN